MRTAQIKDPERFDFFISYTACDQEFARWVAMELGREEFTYRIQAEHFPPGCNFIDRMSEWLEKSEQLIAIISPEYFKSPYAMQEFTAAITMDPLGRRSKVIPVRIKDFEVPALFRGNVYIDFVGKSEKEARHLLINGVRASRHLLGQLQSLDVVRFPGEEKIVQKITDTEKIVISKSSAKPARILFLASDVGSGLDFKLQRRLISSALRQSRHANKIKFKAEFDVNDENIFEKLNHYNPHVVHVSGKQNGGDVLLPTKNGGVTIMTDKALAGLLSSLGEEVRVAIIDTCASLNCAERVADVVDCAIGVGDDIFDDEATRFYQVFYQALGAGKSIADAHRQAVTALRIWHVPMKRIPKLRMKKGLDPSRYFLVGS